MRSALLQQQAGQESNKQDQEQKKKDPEKVLPARLINTGHRHIQVIPLIAADNKNPLDDHSPENGGIFQMKFAEGTGMCFINGSGPLKGFHVAVLFDHYLMMKEADKESVNKYTHKKVAHGHFVEFIICQ